MQLTILALALGSASAFVAPAAPAASAPVKATKEEVVALAEANPECVALVSRGGWP